MEMLYRLSYVGAHDGDHPSGQHGSDANEAMDAGSGGLEEVEPGCARKRHTTPRRLPLRKSSRGVARIRESSRSEPVRQPQRTCAARVMATGITRPRVMGTDATRSLTDSHPDPNSLSRHEPDHLGAANPTPIAPDSPTGEWSGKRDSNPRPSAWKADALAAELFPHRWLQAIRWWRGKDSNLRRHKPADLQSAPFGRSGTPPQRLPRPGARDQAAQLPAGRQGPGPAGTSGGPAELAKGLEPPTTSLQMRCSTN